MAALTKKFETQRTGTNQSFGAFRAAKWRAQNFTVRETHVITSVNLKLSRVLNPGTITISITAVDVSNKPTGADLCSATLAGSSVTADGSGDIYNFDFRAGTTLAVNTKYAIIARTDTGDAANYITWFAAGGVYTYGNLIESEDSGGSWSHNTSYDLWFSENGNIPGGPALYDSYSGTATPFIAVTLDDPDEQAFQSFTPLFNYGLEAVHLNLRRTGGDVGTLYLDVYIADGSGKPTGGSLGAATVELPDDDLQYAWIPFVFSLAISLTSGQQYCAVLRGPSFSAANKLVWPADDNGFGSSVFEGGDRGYSFDGGSSWGVDTDRDLLFRCYGIGTEENAPGLKGFGTNGTLSTWNGVDAWELIVPRLENNNTISCVIQYDSKIYAGTSAGNLLVWSGANAWIKAADAPTSPAVGAINGLEIYNDKIYAHAGAYLLEWDGFGDWLFRSPNTALIGHLKSFNGKLYACGNDTNEGRLFEWNDVDDWNVVAPTYTSYERLLTLEVFNGRLYAGAGGTLGAGLLEWNDVDAWVLVAPKLNNQLSIGSMAVFNSELYGGTYNLAELHKWNEVDAWTEVSERPGTENYINALIEYQESLYGGTASGGLLVVWDGVSEWTTVAPINDSQTSITALLVFNLAPEISDESTAQALLVGQVLSLSITASGDGNTYQWYHDDIAIDGATSTTYEAVVNLAGAGNYKCIVTNPGGSATSSQIPVTVTTNPYRINMFNLYLDHNELS